VQTSHARPSAARGLSLVEFMVGIAVGLFVVGGALKLFVDYMGTNKRQLLESRVNQEVRAAADIVVRDLRRAGYWQNSLAGLAASNPYATASMPSGSELRFAYARNADDTVDNNEQVGFRQATSGGVSVLQMQDGLNNWQSITDPGTVSVTFAVTEVSASGVDISSYCPCLPRLTCVDADMDDTTKNPQGRRTLTVRTYQVALTAQSIVDPAIRRTVNETVRLRNPTLSGGCPPP
jgi:prepilin peptidase dependent protein B